MLLVVTELGLPLVRHADHLARRPFAVALRVACAGPPAVAPPELDWPLFPGPPTGVTPILAREQLRN